jgi:serine protease Do
LCAIFGLDAVAIKRGSKFLQPATECRLILVLLLALIGTQIESRAQPPQNRNGSAPLTNWLAVPKPAPIHSNELSPAFTKPAPTSIADLKAIEAWVKVLVPRLSPAVVGVEVGAISGSGVIISGDGLVLTAGHVCGGSGRGVRFIFPDGKTAVGKTLGRDTESDTGLMKITSPGRWQHAPVGELTQNAIGDWVLALGHPGGFDPQRSVVVRLGRIIRLAPGVVQTDCPISAGDSGGPLFDMHGRVIAIHSAISTSVAQNFHVPVTEFYATWGLLVKSETDKIQARVPKVYFGATVSEGTYGCCLSTVQPGSPASEAGLEPGDWILKVDERDVKVPASFQRWLAESQPGETLNLEIKRGEKVFPLNVKLVPPVETDSTAGPNTRNQKR